MIGYIVGLVVIFIVLIVICRDYQNPVEVKKHNESESEMAKSKRKQKDQYAKERVIPRWFVVQGALDQISEAEKIIASELNKYNIDWYREVAFEQLKTENGGYARYDFLLITPKGVHIIEYDGKKSHSTKEQKDRDELKNKFCINNGIKITRYNSKHYYYLDREIALLMMKYGISEKRR